VHKNSEHVTCESFDRSCSVLCDNCVRSGIYKLLGQIIYGMFIEWLVCCFIQNIFERQPAGGMSSVFYHLAILCLGDQWEIIKCCVVAGDMVILMRTWKK
jgi:hypothetical protein